MTLQLNIEAVNPAVEAPDFAQNTPDPEIESPDPKKPLHTGGGPTVR